MIAAQGDQESLLDQSKKNPSGAVGIMQVIPKYAAASPINISDVASNGWQYSRWRQNVAQH